MNAHVSLKLRIKMKALRTFGSLIIAVTLGKFAQAADLAGATTLTRDGPNSAERMIADIQGREQFKSLVKSDNLAEAESAIVASNRSKPSTAAWHYESATRILHVIQDNPGVLAGEKGASILQRVRFHLAEAESKATSPIQRASARATLGYVEERFAGNSVEAKAAYAAATDLAGNNGGAAAKEALKRMQVKDRSLPVTELGGNK